MTLTWDSPAIPGLIPLDDMTSDTSPCYCNRSLCVYWKYHKMSLYVTACRVYRSFLLTPIFSHFYDIGSALAFYCIFDVFLHMRSRSYAFLVELLEFPEGRTQLSKGKRHGWKTNTEKAGSLNYWPWCRNKGMERRSSFLTPLRASVLPCQHCCHREPRSIFSFWILFCCIHHLPLVLSLCIAHFPCWLTALAGSLRFFWPDQNGGLFIRNAAQLLWYEMRRPLGDRFCRHCFLRMTAIHPFDIITF